MVHRVYQNMHIDCIVPSFILQSVLLSLCKLFPRTITLCFLHHGLGLDEIVPEAGVRTQLHVPRELFVHYDMPNIPIARFNVNSKQLSDILRNVKNCQFIRFLHTDDMDKCITIITHSLHDDVTEHRIVFSDNKADSSPFYTAIKQITDRPLAGSNSYWFPLNKLRQTLISSKGLTDRLKPPSIALQRNLSDTTEFRLQIDSHQSFHGHTFKLSAFGSKLNVANGLDLYTPHFRAFWWPITTLCGDICKHNSRITMSDDFRTPYATIQILLDWRLDLRITFISSDLVQELRTGQGASTATADAAVPSDKEINRMLRSIGEQPLSPSPHQ